MKLVTTILFSINFMVFINAQTSPYEYYSLPYPSTLPKDTLSMMDKLYIDELNRPFPGCDYIRNEKEKFYCAREKMEKSINAQLVYPDSAWYNNIEGIVVVKFIIEKHGSVNNFELVHDIGHGCGAEVLRILKKMPPFEPGRARGRPLQLTQYVSVEFSKIKYFLDRVNITSN